MTIFLENRKEELKHAIQNKNYLEKELKEGSFGEEMRKLKLEYHNKKIKLLEEIIEKIKSNFSEKNREKLLNSMIIIGREMKNIIELEDPNGVSTLNNLGGLLEYYPFERCLVEVETNVDRFISALQMSKGENENE